jgi:hypothetical protein
MANDYYNHGSWPATGAPGASSPARSELDAITAGFAKIAPLTGNANRAVVVNASGTAQTVTVGAFSLAGDFTLSGAFGLTLVVGATVTLTLPTISDTLVGRTTTDTLTNKTLTTPIIAAILTNGGAATLTLPTTTDTLVGRATTDTLTNKTLTAPIIATIVNGAATLTLPATTDTIVGRATTDTLTNKTLNLANNTLTGTTAQFNIALSDGDFVTGASFTAKGGLLVGTGSATFAELAVGANGTIAAADSNQSSGLKYVNVAGESFHGVVRSHPDSDVVNTKIRADLSVATMNDGHVYTPGQGLIFDKSVTGSIGGMQAAAVNSTWNKLYYARKRSDGSEGLWGLRAKDYLLDQQQTTENITTQRTLRLATATATDKIAQGFQLATAGKVEFIDVGLNRISTPTGNFWFTIEADSSGNPSGTPLATSDKYDVGRLSTTTGKVRIPFRSPATLSAAVQYHLVLQADYTRSDTVAMNWVGNTAGGYANGESKDYNGTTWSSTAGANGLDRSFKLYVTQNDTALSLPAGYDQYVQIAWFYIDGSGNIKRVVWLDRDGETAHGASWDIGNITSTAPLLTDLSAFIPPAPVRVTFGFGGDTSGAKLAVGPISSTDIAATSDTLGRAGYLQATVESAAYPQATGVAAVVLEYQAAMFVVSAGTFGAYVSGIKW